MSRKHSAILGLGSNLGRKSANLCSAVRQIAGFCDILKVSPVYKTASLLKDDQDSYFNICVLLETDMRPDELLFTLKHIEKKMGRTYSGHWYTRLIDIDILDFNGEVFESDKLQIPHPRMAERSFVLLPLKDVMPEYRHPSSCQSIDHMIDLIKDDLGIIKLGDALWRL